MLKEVVSSVNLILSSKHARNSQTPLILSAIPTLTEGFASFPQQHPTPTKLFLFNLTSTPLDQTRS